MNKQERSELSHNLVEGLLAWALEHGVLADSIANMNAATDGDAGLAPFTHDEAEFFRTRKIMRVSFRIEGNRSVISIYSRLGIAKTKVIELKQVFDGRYSEKGIRLEVAVSKPFKVDQNIQSAFEPIYRHGKVIACGSSVGLGNQRNAGTLTALGVTKDGMQIGISCNHVTGGCNTARPGTPIVVPGIQDVSPEHDAIHVVGFHDFTGPMSQGIPSVFNVSKNCDIAFFQLIDDASLSSMQGSGDGSYDTPITFAKISRNLAVKKWGRSTKLTRGRVTNTIREPEPIEYNVTSYYGPTSSQVFKGTVYFEGIYEVESLDSSVFSAGGDSGALVVTAKDGEEKIVGILIGGNKDKSYVLPLKRILKNQKVTLINGRNISAG